MGSDGNGNGANLPKITVEFEVSGETEEREGYWACRNNEFKVTTYGSSREEAETKMSEAVDLMLDLLYAKSGIQGVGARLNELGVYHVVQVVGGTHVHRFKRTERKQLLTEAK